MAWLLEDDKLTFMQTPWVIGYFLRGWQMDVPEGHQVKADLKPFLGGIRPQIHQKRSYLSKKSSSSLLKLQLRKDNPDGSKEYTDPVLCHKQEAVLNANKIDGALHVGQERQPTAVRSVKASTLKTILREMPPRLL